MHQYQIPIWKSAPFVRIISPFITGILLQWIVPFSFNMIICCLLCSFLAFKLLTVVRIGLRYKLQPLQGVFIHLLIAAFSMLLSWKQDIRNSGLWYGNHYTDSTALLIQIAEPLTRKQKSFKATGKIEGVYVNGNLVKATGKILMYFSKDSIVSGLHYGDRILINKPIQRIKNSGNPGAFNYERYASFHQVFHTVYLKGNEFVLLENQNKNLFYSIIYSSRNYVIEALKKYLPADKNVLGIAEALLIGYKEDLDKDLVQAYSNTGVVHIIAISGLHLGLIYVMLVWIFNRMPVIKNNCLLKLFLILGCLWFFALLTGASGSVLRSAVMFTCIVIGKNFFKQSSIYNSLAASAFLLLCFNPYFLWDVGFQLSYLAVIGIVWLQKPFYHLFVFSNKLFDKCWSMLAVALAAQTITFPICIYYFHQFPNLFLLTNLLIVPLSTVILFSEIFLMAVSWLPFIAIFTGKVTGVLVWLMNFIIQTINGLPYSVWDNIHSSMFSTICLYVLIISISRWLLDKNKKWLFISLMAFSSFSVVQWYSKLTANHQKKMIIYNVPLHVAVDFISGNKYYFHGDSIMWQDGVLRNFHLKPSRIHLKLDKNMSELQELYHKDQLWYFFNKRIIMIDSSVQFESVESKIQVDVLLISKNPGIQIAELLTVIEPAIVVFDASNSLWKIANWKKECIGLALPCFLIQEQGAFVLDIE